VSTKNDEPQGFAAMLAEYDGRAKTAKAAGALRLGDTATGRIVAITADAVFVDLGGKAEGMIERSELMDRDGKLTVAVGDAVEARVASVREDNVVLRTRGAKPLGSAAELAQARDLGLPIEGMVSAVNKGGVEVTVAGVRAFCPLSQLDAGFVDDPSTFIGRKLEFVVTSYQEGRGDPNVVLSRRALLEAERAKQAAEVRARLEVGVTVTGTVTSIKDYGAFVDIGGLEGMLHVSELGFARVAHPSEVLTVGQTIDVQVTKIEASDNPKRPERISLSLKALQQDPWREAVNTLPAGSRVRGRVTRLESFGAFVTVGEGLEGLVHVSQLVGDRRISHPREILAVGQEVEVVVLEVDPEKRRISLSVRALDAQQEAEQAASYRRTSSESLGTFADLMKQKLKR
jgi:small subunit ribosomal protein S1